MPNEFLLSENEIKEQKKQGLKIILETVKKFEDIGVEVRDLKVERIQGYATISFQTNLEITYLELLKLKQ